MDQSSRTLRRFPRRNLAVFSLVLVWISLPRPGQESIGREFFETELLPYPSAPLVFEATAYCDYGITKSGVLTAPGIVAADPAVLPLGSVIQVDSSGYRGIYTVQDTGGLVKGSMIDIYIPDYDQAVQFGRRKVLVTVLRYGPARQDSMLAD